MGSSYATLRMVNGTVYGSNADVLLRNTSPNGGAAISVYGPAEYGTFIGKTWNSAGNLNTTNNTIKVVNGAI